MQITVNVSDVDLTTAIDGYSYNDMDPDTRRSRTLADEIVARAALLLVKDDHYKGLKARIAEMRVEEIRRRVSDEVEAGMVEPFRLTTAYGEPKGEPVTMRTMIAEEVKKFFNEKVGDYNRQATRAATVIKTEVEKALHKELSEVIADEKAKVVAAVRAQAATIIADAVKRGIG